MAVGSCFCGKIRVEHNGQPITSAICHCLDCRKITGSLYSCNILVKTAELQISGSPKELSKTSDSGNSIKNYFCPDCGIYCTEFERKHLTKVIGTPLFGRKIESNGEPNEVTVVRAGIFDDLEILNEQKPQVEIYAERRVKWVCPIEGAAQVDGMLPVPSA
ncbi:uncharacterized protein N7500_004658 [Penicillium coprophilum]|uniref:uncharacterized protein n=1 Tax=Penicillium coprophilum TaxID=36646 RepID=UPI00239C5C08|nr:uncharacterized protein N7500_004658 [Penicillium coprophilum]KAJ5162828.1 hypothetical protein N7500_004658 [Penicillium coprophilum]